MGHLLLKATLKGDASESLWHFWADPLGTASGPRAGDRAKISAGQEPKAPCRFMAQRGSKTSKNEYLAQTILIDNSLYRNPESSLYSHFDP